MGRAIELHNASLRALLEDHGGHEVRTDGDSFTLAFHDAVDAVRWCLQVGGPVWRPSLHLALHLRDVCCMMRSAEARMGPESCRCC
jgi:class 3 adenylate cyclase